MIALACLTSPRRAAVFLAVALLTGGLSTVLAQCGADAPALAGVLQPQAQPADRRHTRNDRPQQRRRRGPRRRARRGPGARPARQRRLGAADPHGRTPPHRSSSGSRPSRSRSTRCSASSRGGTEKAEKKFVTRAEATDVIGDVRKVRWMIVAAVVAALLAVALQGRGGVLTAAVSAAPNRFHSTILRSFKRGCTDLSV